MKNFLKILVFILVLSLSYTCSKDKDTIDEDTTQKNIEIESFIWEGMNNYYLWQKNSPNLQDNRFSNQNQLNGFLEGFSSPENLFENILHRPTDRFSWIVSDYIALENLFQGITLSNGMEFVLFYEDGSTENVYGVVRYVVPNSNAASKGVVRGMAFNTVNGTRITNSNYKNLLFSENSNYTIHLADFNAGVSLLNGTSIALTKEHLQENPVAIDTIFMEGTTKIGYLLYNQFASSYDGHLNAAFGNFKANGITDLIVDLRYNGGGSVRTAIYLGSMITTETNQTIYSQQVWNDKILEAVNVDNFLNYFTDNIRNTDENGSVVLEEPINSLNLSSIYFIVTENTASASELVINALSPYIDVNLVGVQTVGKQVGSITLYDSNNFQKNGGNLNLNHKYAMQPIVLEIKNSEGENNPRGYIPEVMLPEDFGQISGNIDLGILGEKSEPLLKSAINYITTGGTLSRSATVPIKKEQITNSKLQRPFANQMYVEF